MGMPITVEVVDAAATQELIDQVYAFLQYVDETFSTYKSGSEISRLNRGEIDEHEASADMRMMLELAEKTKEETGGFFDIRHGDQLDPSGIVKGWAIEEAGRILRQAGMNNYYVEAGGDIIVSGRNAEGQPWTVGIRNPFDVREIVKVLAVDQHGVATSGTYERGQHIYNPHQPGQQLKEIVSLTVVGPNILDADRYATAAFAMGREGVHFIERLPGFEAYSIDRDGQATMTTRFTDYVQS